jgi:hypothetical protein
MIRPPHPPPPQKKVESLTISITYDTNGKFSENDGFEQTPTLLRITVTLLEKMAAFFGRERDITNWFGIYEV